LLIVYVSSDESAGATSCLVFFPPTRTVNGQSTLLARLFVGANPHSGSIFYASQAQAVCAPLFNGLLRNPHAACEIILHKKKPSFIFNPSPHAQTMNTLPLAQLSPVGFLQTFVLELLQLTEEAAGHQTDQIIERIAQSAGHFFEEAYRDESQFSEALDQDRYIDLIVGLKNRIGGHFSLAQDDIKQGGLCQKCRVILNDQREVKYPFMPRSPCEHTFSASARTSLSPQH
jgi:hypothetical protein